MTHCKTTSAEISLGLWRHECSACGGIFHSSTRAYVRPCKASPPAKPRPPIRDSLNLCAHLGAAIRTENCGFCGKRKKLIAVHECAVWGSCSVNPYRAGQPEQDCRSCDQFTPREPVVAEITPIPAGQTVFTPDQWRRLRPDEKEHYRALRRARERQQPPPQAPTPPASLIPADKTPFYSPDGQPIFLGHFGQGASCFIVLGGPSLLTNDLSKLSLRGVWSVGVNNVSAIVKTNAWCSVDSVSKFCDTIWQDPGITKFVHRRFLNRSVRTRKPNGGFADLLGSDGKPLLIREFPGIIGIDRNADFEPSRWLAEPSLNWGQSKKSSKRARDKYPQVLNSMLLVVKLVYSLGFRVAYLVGADFRMDPARPYAFPQTKSAGGCRSNNGSYEKLNAMFGMLQPHFLAAGFSIYNTNRESGLTVFPHVSFDRAIETAISRVPQNETAAGWYDGHAGD